jgi:hypothetical protein
MTRIRVPQPRRGGIPGIVRRIWTWPTSLVGHAVARLTACAGPTRIGSGAAQCWLYRLPPGKSGSFGAIALGHVIIVAPAIKSPPEADVLAHELSHARQHDWLGPAYLPAHAVCQLVSALLHLVRPVPGFPPLHAYNPLERRFLCVPFDALLDPALRASAAMAEARRAFGL